MLDSFYHMTLRLLLKSHFLRKKFIILSLCTQSCHRRQSVSPNICKQEVFFRVYYIPINDMPFELSVFLPADPESRINKLKFSESISLSFKTRLGLLSNSTGNTPPPPSIFSAINSTMC